ncbi:PKD domain-containing protein [Vibrio crassostreae]|uniref:PKD domain-containing protein n=1 Tax=Vibrio crassostreae TaxID=246167 RepID=UPI001B3025C9|nr:hypothetical protein [Vibrio crassostreae]
MTFKLKTLAMCIGSLILVGCNSDSDSGAPTKSGVPNSIISNISDSNERSLVELDGSSSSDSDGTITNYSWEIEDNDAVGVVVAEPTLRKTTLQIGEATETSDVTVKLTVTDNDGNASTSTHTFSVAEIDKSLLPPTPNANESLSGLKGVDSDNNGVRDDVEIAIYELHKDNYENREILKDGARAYEAAIDSAISGRDQDSDAAASKMVLFVACLVDYTDLDSSKELTTLKSFQFNTDERVEAYDKFNRSRHGTSMFSPDITIEDCLPSTDSN